MEKRTQKLFAAFAALVLFSMALIASAKEVSCFYCGMNKSEYGHSWTIVKYSDHSTGEFCSLHCACIDMLLHSEKTAATVLVADYYTKEFTEADKAFWVIGGNRPGVMTTRAKWAFDTKTAAERYIKESGGEPSDYETAVKAAMEDMYQDMMMIQKERKIRRNKMMEGNK
jgi:copper chaperone NosL